MMRGMRAASVEQSVDARYSLRATAPQEHVSREQRQRLALHLFERHGSVCCLDLQVAYSVTQSVAAGDLSELVDRGLPAPYCSGIKTCLAVPSEPRSVPRRIARSDVTSDAQYLSGEDSSSTSTAAGDVNLMPVGRRNAIAQFVTIHQWATIRELASLVGASDSTVRRDLGILELRGAVVRVHGGACRPT
jgi:hypothetical protein